MQSLKAHFLSDLHLLSRRSTATQLTPEIQAIAKQSHTMILGGDIFDFKWSIHQSLDASIEEAIDWLDRLVATAPRCEFRYVLGNHDSHPRFVAALDRIANHQPRLRWYQHEMRIGECVFLHGDIVDGRPSKSDLEQRRIRLDSSPAPSLYRHWLYDMVVRARLHRAAMHVVIRPKRVLRKLTQYLAAEGLSFNDGVRDVYFGHTHQVVDGLMYGGLRFHNGGAAIRGLPFRIIEIELQRKEGNLAKVDEEAGDSSSALLIE